MSGRCTLHRPHYHLLQRDIELYCTVCIWYSNALSSIIYTTCIGTVFGTVLYKALQQCFMVAADHSIKVQSCGRLAYSSQSNAKQTTAVYRLADDIHITAPSFLFRTPTTTTNVSQCTRLNSRYAQFWCALLCSAPHQGAAQKAASLDVSYTTRVTHTRTMCVGTTPRLCAGTSVTVAL